MHVPLLRIITIVAAFVLMVMLWFLVNKTRTGKAMRATSYDREAAAMMGIDIDRVIVFTFVLGSALAGAGRRDVRRCASRRTVSIGFVAGLKGFTAAVIGGIGSIPGAMAGGLILGFAESYIQGYISTKWSRPVRLLDPDRVHDLPAAGPARPRGHPEGLMTDSTPHGSHVPAEGPAVGQDEWVARHAERRFMPGGPLGTIEDRIRRVPWWAWLILFLAAALDCSRVVEPSGYVRHVAFSTVLYMLLALGLNVVVGWGGLLDLGYVAFYGIGAYAYAMLDSPTIRHPPSDARLVPLIVAIGGASSGFLLGLPSRRLTGDYLAIVTLFFLQLFQTITTNGDAAFGHNITGGPFGILQRRPVRPLGKHELAVAAQGRLRRLVLLRRARGVRGRLRRAAPRQPLAHRPRVALAARGPARRRGDGHAGELAEADELLLRRGGRRAHRHALRGAERRASSRSRSTSCC